MNGMISNLHREMHSAVLEECRLYNGYPSVTVMISGEDRGYRIVHFPSAIKREFRLKESGISVVTNR